MKDFDSLTSGYEKTPKIIIKRVSYFFIVFIILFFLIITGLIIAFKSGFNPTKVHWYAIVNSKKFNEKIFINCIGFGVTGDHRIVKISKHIDNSLKKRKNDYFLDCFCMVSYKFLNDTLFICSEEEFTKPILNDIAIKTPISFIDFNSLRILGEFSKLNEFKTISPYQE